MPTSSRWMIRSALVYLLIGFAIGAFMLVGKAYPAYARAWILLPVHIEILVFGFVIQFTMGTAYWILPRFLEKHSRGPAIISQSMVGLLNTGVLVNVFYYLNLAPAWGSLAGRGLEIGAVIFFVSLHWNRAVSHR